MYKCDGQMSLLDWLNPKAISEPPILLKTGQQVYRVRLGDVIDEIVYDEKSWICGENNRGYRLMVINGCYDCTWNTEIGRNVFTDRNRAEDKANSYTHEHHDIIKADDIKATRVVAYSYNYNNMEHIAFYADIGNGMYYFHYGSIYDHISSRDNAKKEIEKFESERHAGAKVLDNYKPHYKNMYPVKHDSWDYGPCRYADKSIY